MLPRRPAQDLAGLDNAALPAAVLTDEHGEAVQRELRPLDRPQPLDPQLRDRHASREAKMRRSVKPVLGSGSPTSDNASVPRPAIVLHPPARALKLRSD